MTRRRAILVGGVTLALTVLAGAPLAYASGILGTGIGPTLGPDLNPLPSVGGLLHGIVGGLFGALLSALTPGFLRHADINTLRWLVMVPNAADTTAWPTVGRLEQDMVWVAGAILPTALIVGTLRDSMLSLASRAHPASSLVQFTTAVFCLLVYRFAVMNGVAFVNVLTDTMLSWPVVAQGLHRTVLVMFGGSLLVGQGGAFLALLGLVALVFALTLFMLKVLLLVVLAVLFVAGPLFISLLPLPALGHLAQAWLLGLLGLCLIPVGWCVIFATAGAFSLDVTNIGGGAHIEGRVLGAFAALATFYLAYKWPLLVLGHVRGALGGLGVRTSGGGAGGGGGGLSGGTLAARATRARRRLHAAMLTGGRGLGAAAGALGAPAGGPVGAGARGARPHLAAGALSAAVAMGPPWPRPRPSQIGERAARAGEELLRTPQAMGQAWRAGRPQRPRSTSRPGSNNAPRPQTAPRAGQPRVQPVVARLFPARRVTPQAAGSPSGSTAGTGTRAGTRTSTRPAHRPAGGGGPASSPAAAQSATPTTAGRRPTLTSTRTPTPPPLRSAHPPPAAAKPGGSTAPPTPVQQMPPSSRSVPAVPPARRASAPRVPPRRVVPKQAALPRRVSPAKKVRGRRGKR
jgi:hypothetical protein